MSHKVEIKFICNSERLFFDNIYFFLLTYQFLIGDGKKNAGSFLCIPAQKHIPA